MPWYRIEKTETGWVVIRYSHALGREWLAQPNKYTWAESGEEATLFETALEALEILTETVREDNLNWLEDTVRKVHGMPALDCGD